MTWNDAITVLVLAGLVLGVGYIFWPRKRRKPGAAHSDAFVPPDVALWAGGGPGKGHNKSDDGPGGGDSGGGDAGGGGSGGGD